LTRGPNGQKRPCKIVSRTEEKRVSATKLSLQMMVFFQVNAPCRSWMSENRPSETIQSPWRRRQSIPSKRWNILPLQGAETQNAITICWSITSKT